MKAKKWIALVLVLAILGGAGFGGVKYLKSRGGEVNVYPVSSFSTSADWISAAQTDGVVSTDRIQSVYLSSTQVVTEIYVTEGQQVRAGDPLLAFDTTLSELSLERQAIRVSQLKLDLENAEKELRKIDTYRIGSPVEYEPEMIDPAMLGELLLAEAPYMPFNQTEDSLGTANDPIIYLWSESCVLDAAFLSQTARLALDNRAAYRAAGGSSDAADETASAAGTAPEDAAKSAPHAAGRTLLPVKPVSYAGRRLVMEALPADTLLDGLDPVDALDAAEPDDTPEPEPTDTPEPEPTDTPEPEPTDTPEPEPTDTPEPEPTDTPEPLPPVDPEVLGTIDDPHVYVVLETRESDAVNGEVLRAVELVILTDEATGSWSLQLIAPLYEPEETPTDTPEEEPEDAYDFPYDDTVYYTADEIAKLRSEANQRIRDLTLDLKSAELEYDRLEYELSTGEVRAKIDGIVKTVRTPDEAMSENRPVILVSGGGGYYVTAVLGEFELDTMQPGDPVTVQSWESGEQVQGEIVDISLYPDETNQYWYYSEGNQNVSKYPFRVFVNEDANLRDGEGVTLSYSAAGTQENGLYLELPFIRQENGKSYVLAAGEDGLLEKRFVRTGRNLWGSYLEILDGLGEDDYIAFPYGRQTVEGARTRQADADELYSYVYR